MVASATDEGDPNNGDGLVGARGHHSLPGHPDIEVLDSDKERSRTLQTIAGVAGNVLEWYDFAVFGFFSDIIAENFFPPQEGNAALVESFAVFGGAFVMRPVGGLIMGYIGDVYGRKKALELSIFLMAFPTFAMGCLPTYDKIGWVAVILLVIIRLLQGMSAGGQIMSSLVFTVEKRPKESWGLWGSFVMASANCGTLLGGVVGYGLRATLSYDQLYSWGWRIPFLSGILVSVSGFYLKFCVEEDSLHKDLPADIKPENPIKIAFSAKHRRALLSCCMVPALWSGGFYVSFVWMAIFMADLVEPPIDGAFAINSIALLFSVCLMFPVAGALSDVHGRIKVMTVGGSCALISAPFLFGIIGMGNSLHALIAQCCLGIFLCLWGAPMMAWLVEGFPPEARLTAVSIGFNICHAIIGGSAPALATVIVDRYGAHGPGYLVSATAVIALCGLCLAPSSWESGSDGANESANNLMGNKNETEVVSHQVPYVNYEQYEGKYIT